MDLRGEGHGSLTVHAANLKLCLHKKPRVRSDGADQNSCLPPVLVVTITSAVARMDPATALFILVADLILNGPFAKSHEVEKAGIIIDPLPMGKVKFPYPRCSSA